jgi:hypothetical protein
MSELPDFLDALGMSLWDGRAIRLLYGSAPRQTQGQALRICGQAGCSAGAECDEARAGRASCVCSGRNGPASIGP